MRHRVSCNSQALNEPRFGSASNSPIFLLKDAIVACKTSSASSFASPAFIETPRISPLQVQVSVLTIDTFGTYW